MQHLKSELVLAVHRLLRNPEVVPSQRCSTAALVVVCIFGERAFSNTGFRTMCWLFNVRRYNNL